MASVRVGGRELAFEDTGGDGSPLVLGHGFFLDRSCFAPQAAALGPEWRVISWDARGHGETPDDGEPFSYWDLARDLLGLLDALGLERAVVGGISQGGFTALRAALLAPERVAGLVLMDTEATPCDPEDRAGYEQLFAALAELGPVDDLAGPLAAQLLGDEAVERQWRQAWRERPLPLGAPARCLMERDDVSGRLGEIACPALLLWGSEDRSLPVDRMQLLADRLPGADGVAVIDGAAHTPSLTRPDAVNAQLTAFRTRLATGTPSVR